MRKSLILLAMVIFSVFFFTACGAQGVASSGDALSSYGNAIVSGGDAMVSGGDAMVSSGDAAPTATAGSAG